jgi:hypothetical protein
VSTWKKLSNPVTASIFQYTVVFGSSIESRNQSNQCWKNTVHSLKAVSLKDYCLLSKSLHVQFVTVCAVYRCMHSLSLPAQHTAAWLANGCLPSKWNLIWIKDASDFNLLGVGLEGFLGFQWQLENKPICQVIYHTAFNEMATWYETHLPYDKRGFRCDKRNLDGSS